MLVLQLSFYCPLCYNSRAHCPLLQSLCTTSAILAGAHYYFVVPSFKCEGKIVAINYSPTLVYICNTLYRICMYIMLIIWNRHYRTVIMLACLYVYSLLDGWFVIRKSMFDYRYKSSKLTLLQNGVFELLLFAVFRV